MEDEQCASDFKVNKPEIRYKVYMEHFLGGKVHWIGTFDTREEAEIERDKTDDGMFDAWIREEEE